MRNSLTNTPNSGLRTKDKCRVHTWFRVHKNNKRFRTDYYFCRNCPSYIPVKMILGRSCICYLCTNEFRILRADQVRLKPICDRCAKKNIMNLPEVPIVLDRRNSRNPVENPKGTDWLSEDSESDVTESVMDDIISIIDKK